MGFNGLYEVSTPQIDRSQEDLHEPEVIAQDQTTTEDLEIAFSRVAREIPAGRDIRFRVVLEGWAQALHPLIRDEVYRIGREALLNAFRHSEANSVEINLQYTPKRLCLSVRDDGKGISPELFRSGCRHCGLLRMQQTAERMGAKLNVLSRIAFGTEVVLSIPGQIAYKQQTKVRRLGWAYFSGRSA